MERRGSLFVVSAPSGAGKTTLCKQLASHVPGLKHSTSYTTRLARQGEIHGREYFFVDERYFQDLVERNEFVEWAQVYGHRYGTPRTAMVELMDEGIDVLLEIDVQGARQIKKTFEDAVFVYISPHPSMPCDCGLSNEPEIPPKRSNGDCRRSAKKCGAIENTITSSKMTI